MRLREEASVFGSRQAEATAQARQLAALQLACGIDLSAALEADGECRANLVRRVERIIERERLKGVQRHWSYDLNRHIALKQVLDRLRGRQAAKEEATKAKWKTARPNRNGAERRRGLPTTEKTKISATACACAPGPSSSPGPSGRRRSWEPPSDR